MHTDNPVSKILSDLGINHRVFRHVGKVSSLQQAANERGQDALQVVRSIVFRLSQGEYVLVVMNGPSQISWRKLRNYLSQSRLTLANDEEVLQATGYRPGTVSPIGVSNSVRVLVDEGLLKVDEVSIGSGIRGEAVILKSSDLLDVIDIYEIGQFCDDEE